MPIIPASQRTAETEADRFLKKYWVQDGIVMFPVDPFQIAQKLGIEVSHRQGLPDDVSGLLLRERPDTPIKSVINANRPNTHQRFTMAHELGHYSILENAGKIDDPIGFVERRSELSSAGTDKVEIFSNQFAAALLMPEGAVRFYAKDGKNLQELASIFSVSEKAMSYRLDALGISA